MSNSEIDIGKLRAVAEAATPGEWSGILYVDAPEGGIVSKDENITIAEMTEPHNIAHISTFDPPTVLALLSRLEEAESIVRELGKSVHATDEGEGVQFEIEMSALNGGMLAKIWLAARVLKGEG